jgi:APA family basic amino acid/polyamine antiporter
MPYGFEGVMLGAATVFFAYIGFDAVSTAAEEVRNPQRDLPIGLIASLTVCTILYIVVSLILTGMVPYQLLNVADPVAFALQYVKQDAVAGIISVGAISGITTVLLVVLYGQIRVTYAMSRDGLLPRVLSSVNVKTQTPLFNTWTMGIIAALIAGLVDLRTLAHLVNIGTLAAFFLVAIAVIILRYTKPELKRAFKVPFVPVLPLISAGGCLYLMVQLPAMTWQAFGIWLTIGSLIYFMYSRKNSVLGQEEQ